MYTLTIKSMWQFIMSCHVILLWGTDRTITTGYDMTRLGPQG